MGIVERSLDSLPMQQLQGALDSYRAGRAVVRSCEGEGAVVDVRVPGEPTREVLLDWGTGRFGVLLYDCPCGHASRERLACLHVGAALMCLDREGIDVEGSGPLRLERLDRFFGGGFRLRRPPREDPERWRRQLDELRRLVPAPVRLRSIPGQVTYLLDPEGTRRESRLVVAFLHQRPKKVGGGFTKPKFMEGNVVVAARLEDAEDRELVRLLSGAAPIHYGALRGYVPEAVAAALLPRLCATGRFAAPDPEGGLVPLAYDDGPPWALELEMRRARGALSLDARLRRGEETRELRGDEMFLAGGLAVLPGLIVRYEGADAGAWTAALRRVGPVRVAEPQALDAVKALLEMPGAPRLRLPDDIPVTTVSVVPVPRVLFLNGPDPKVVPTRAYFGYDTVMVAADDARPSVLDPPTGRILTRDPVAEKEALVALQRHGVVAASLGGHEVPAAGFGSAVRGLLAAGWLVEARGLKLRAPGDTRFRVTTGIDWFDLEGEVDYGGVSVALPAILAAVRAGSDFVPLGDGTHGVLPEEWLARARRLAGIAAGGEGETVRFSSAQAVVLDALLAAESDVEVDARFAEIRERLRSGADVRPEEAPPGFSGILRPYQKQGLAWLLHTRAAGLHGILADDMGLGKTIQVLAMLKHLARKRGKPALIVCPKSLKHNWIEEARRFTPSLSFLDFTGDDRWARLEASTPAPHAVVTTYGIVRRDIARLREVTFSLAIVDEAQAIKNADSQSAKACRLLRAEHRVALTGTPLENHVGELWSILEFLNPGISGQSRLAQALLSGRPTPELLDVLARAVRPLLLRRTKAQVLADLPERTEQTLWCELSTGERKTYDELKAFLRKDLTRRVEEDGLNRSKIHVLEALLRLRQAACHPGLLAAARSGEDSAKVTLLCDHVQEVVSEGHKVLVFSQFVKLLSIVRAKLIARGISFAYLDGKTRDRKAAVDLFQSPEGPPVFLISLKAGGVGLNLTAASYVYVLDPWWNPAVEAQAIDRAHRIGQTRAVTAYRLIGRETVEERILELQRSKKELADAIVAADGGVLRGITAEDLDLLLS